MKFNRLVFALAGLSTAAFADSAQLSFTNLKTLAGSWQGTYDGKTVDFNFLDVANFYAAQGGYMQHAVFTTLDPDHHSEHWTFLFQGQPVNARIDLTRTK